MDISKSYDANFVFLGHRSYIHGSSMTYGLLDAVKSWSMDSIKRLQLNVRALLKEQGKYDLFCNEREKNRVEKKYNAMFRLQCGKDIFFVGLKGRKEPVSISESYDEEKLITGCQILKGFKAATLILHPDKLIINTMIALNKNLVNTLFPSEGYSQWFLTRYDLVWEKTHMVEPTLLKIEVVGNIGSSHTNSAIKFDGKTIGSMYFSRNITQ